MAYSRLTRICTFTCISHIRLLIHAFTPCVWQHWPWERCKHSSMVSTELLKDFILLKILQYTHHWEHTKIPSTKNKILSCVPFYKLLFKLLKSIVHRLCEHTNSSQIPYQTCKKSISKWNDLENGIMNGK